jgi:dual specificity MAP kinase phosphatase
MLKEVIPRLWLSGITAARDREFLEKQNIKYVLNMSEDQDKRTYLEGVEYCTKYACYDTIDTILPLKETTEWLKERHKNTEEGVLVHCIAGRNRSVAIIFAYLMMEHNYSFEQALEAVGKQPENSSFVSQLRQIQSKT